MEHALGKGYEHFYIFVFHLTAAVSLISRPKDRNSLPFHALKTLFSLLVINPLLRYL